VSDQVSHPYKTVQNIIIRALYIEDETEKVENFSERGLEFGTALSPSVERACTE
jgi:hypothetical protein